MEPNRITRGGAMPRAGALAALATALALAAALLAGCGGGTSSTGGSSASTSGGAAAIPTPKPSPEESADAAILDTVLSRQEAVVDAFAAVIPHLAPRSARMASLFRAQEQEHVDAVMKELRGLKSPPEPKAEAIEVPAAKTETERLVFLYEVESVTIGDELNAIAGLEAGSPRSTLASTVGNQAQHLVLLRRALGAGPLAAIPSPFENGTAPAP
jgi:hypothetical protein